MPLYPTLWDIALRLIFTIVAAGLIGFDRETRGHAAGLRTTILVGLAASVSMIQANLLLSMTGKTAESFAVMDLMRLPLGILTGVGFIGGGAILRRGVMVKGVTTAATLWIVTVIGLCMGGGQLMLGSTATLLGLATLWGLKLVDLHVPRTRRAKLVVEIAGAAEVEDPAAAHSLQTLLKRCDHRLLRQAETSDGRRLATFEIRWKGPSDTEPPEELLALISQLHRMRSFEILEGEH